MMKQAPVLLSLASGINAFLLMSQQIAHERADPIVDPGMFYLVSLFFIQSLRLNHLRLAV